MFTKGNPDYLVRSSIWSTEVKRILEDELMAAKLVRQLSGFPDGDTFNIPSWGQMTVDNYSEDEAVTYRSVDTGNFQFSITDYISSAYYVTEKAKQDSFYMNQLMADMPRLMNRALMVDYETKVLNLAMSQTTANANTINGAAHRWVGSGSSQTIALEDFAKAKYSFKKANVTSNLIAIVDPSVAYAIDTLTNIVNVSNNPMWEGIVTTGMQDATGMRFIRNIYGFDVYVSNYLADANETIAGKTTTAGKANIFMTTSPEAQPFVGAWRQSPKVDSEYNKDRQREEHVLTARYGLKLFRPEALAVVLTDTNAITF